MKIMANDAAGEMMMEFSRQLMQPDCDGWPKLEISSLSLPFDLDLRRYLLPSNHIVPHLAYPSVGCSENEISTHRCIGSLRTISDDLDSMCRESPFAARNHTNITIGKSKSVLKGLCSNGRPILVCVVECGSV
jgi:hypothetical protein